MHFYCVDAQFPQQSPASQFQLTWSTQGPCVMAINIDDSYWTYNECFSTSQWHKLEYGVVLAAMPWSSTGLYTTLVGASIYVHLSALVVTSN